MSVKQRKKNKTPQAKPWFTKFRGYQFVESGLRDSRMTLVAAGSMLNDLNNVDKTDLLVGEIQAIANVDSVMRLKVPEIAKEYSNLSSELLAFVKEKRPLDEMDFKPLVDKTLEFIGTISEAVAAPMGEVDEILTKAIARKNKDNVDV